jgi:DNA-binding GntR family transcriptional regulator
MAHEVDHWSEEPRYLQLARFLREDIRSGRLQPGQVLEGEKGLAREYRVARATVRRALEILRDEGLLQTVHRVGTRVRPPEDWQQ